MDSEQLGPCFTFIDQATGALHILDLLSGPGIKDEPLDRVDLLLTVVAKMTERDLETRYGTHEVLFVEPAILGYGSSTVQKDQWEDLIQEWREILTEVGFTVGSHYCSNGAFVVEVTEPEQAEAREPQTILPAPEPEAPERGEYVAYVEPSPKLSLEAIIAHVESVGADVKHVSPAQRVIGIIAHFDEIKQLDRYPGVSLVTKGWGSHRHQWIPNPEKEEAPLPTLDGPDPTHSHHKGSR